MNKNEETNDSLIDNKFCITLGTLTKKVKASEFKMLIQNKYYSKIFYIPLIFAPVKMPVTAGK